jgi:hypothetical protein
MASGMVRPRVPITRRRALPVRSICCKKRLTCRPLSSISPQRCKHKNMDFILAAALYQHEIWNLALLAIVVTVVLYMWAQQIT